MESGVGRVVMLEVDAEVPLPPLVLAMVAAGPYWRPVEAEERLEEVGGKVWVGWGGLRGVERVGEDCCELVSEAAMHRMIHAG